jgi:hypothetical protein
MAVPWAPVLSFSRKACSNPSITMRMPRMNFSVTTSLATSPRSLSRYLR